MRKIKSFIEDALVIIIGVQLVILLGLGIKDMSKSAEERVREYTSASIKVIEDTVIPTIQDRVQKAINEARQ